jgi:hypothetical protein
MFGNKKTFTYLHNKNLSLADVLPMIQFYNIQANIQAILIWQIQHSRFVKSTWMAINLNGSSVETWMGLQLKLEWVFNWNLRMGKLEALRLVQEVSLKILRSQSVPNKQCSWQKLTASSSFLHYQEFKMQPMLLLCLCWLLCKCRSTSTCLEKQTLNPVCPVSDRVCCSLQI